MLGAAAPRPPPHGYASASKYNALDSPIQQANDPRNRLSEAYKVIIA